MSQCSNMPMGSYNRLSVETQGAFWAEECILGGYCEVLLKKASSWMSVEQLRQDLTPYRVPIAYI